MEGSSKKEKGLVDMNNSVLIAGGVGYKGINVDWKKYNKIFFKITKLKIRKPTQQLHFWVYP